MTITDAAIAFQDYKTLLLDVSGLSKDSLHIYVGLAAFIGTRLLWRRRGGWVLAWLAALTLALAGEWLDLRGENLRNAIQPDSAHWHDIWNTMFWPTVLLLIGRWLQPAPVSVPLSDADPLSNEGTERGVE